MTDHEEDARDIQQETFLRAFRHLRNFRSEASFRTWLGTITARVCLTHRARRKVRPVESLEDRHNLASGDRDLAEQVSARDEARAVQRALTVLRADDRLVLVLKCVEGFSHEEIAETLGCSVDNSRVRLYRARKAFRAAFGQEYEL